MTSSEHRREPSGCGADVAAYVLGALEPEETQALQEHLATCAVCRDELASLRGVADALPLAAPQLAVPRGLKRRVMSQIGDEASSARGAASSARRAARPGHRRWLPAGRPAALAGALAAAVAVVLAVVLASSGSSGPRLVRASVTAPGASAVVRLGGGQAALIVRHMPEPPAGKIYQVWLQRGRGAPTPTNALFGVTSRGSAAVAVPGNLHGVSAVLVTPERQGGSAVPTHAPVIVAYL